MLLHSAGRRENQLGRTEFCGASNPKLRLWKTTTTTRRQHWPLPKTDRTSIRSWSHKTSTAVTWATESVTTSPWWRPSAWRWARRRCRTQPGHGKSPSLLTSSPSPAAEEVFRHTAGVHFSCGCVERRRGCMSDLHRPRRLHVIHVGLDWPVQGAGVDYSIHPSIHLTLVWFECLGLVFLQIGFKSASDYETFAWVREDELPEINEVIQVQRQWGTCDVTLWTHASLTCVSSAAIHWSWWDPSAGWRVCFGLLQHKSAKHHWPQHQLSGEHLLLALHVIDISYSLHKYLLPFDLSMHNIRMYKGVW